MATIWRQIPNFESYEASTDGNIRNFKTKKLLARCGKNDGYLYVTMYHNGKYHNRSIHTMVARSFLQNPEAKRTVNHKDRNGLNNSLENLEWATYTEQQIHISQNGGRMEPRKREKAMDLPGECWKKIDHVEFSNDWDYYLSNKGRIKDKNGVLKIIRRDKRGYCSNKICQHWFSVHCLMVKVFLGCDVSSTTVVNHKDGDKSNNCIENLEVISQSDNIKHAYHTGLNIKKNKRSVLQVDYKGDIINVFESLTDVEKTLGFNRGSIHNALKTKKTRLGYKWFESNDEYKKEKEGGNILIDFFKVIQCDDKGDILAAYDSYPAACEATRTSVTNISRSCKSNMKAGGFKWFQCYADYLAYTWKL